MRYGFSRLRMNSHSKLRFSSVIVKVSLLKTFLYRLSYKDFWYSLLVSQNLLTRCFFTSVLNHEHLAFVSFFKCYSRFFWVFFLFLSEYDLHGVHFDELTYYCWGSSWSPHPDDGCMFSLRWLSPYWRPCAVFYTLVGWCLFGTFHVSIFYSM